MDAFNKSGQLNKAAALLTGISVILGAIGNFLAAF
jgi:hypothetical protein